MSVYEKMGALVSSFRDHPHSELEVTFNDTTIEGGVKFTVFKELFDSLCKATLRGIVFENPQQAIIDYFYEGDVRCRYVAGRSPVCVRKTRMDRCDMHCPQRPDMSIRANLKNEEPMEMKLIPDSPPTHVRLQERWVFSIDGRFEIVLSKVVGGKDKQDACDKDPTFAVELEMQRNVQFLQDKTDTEIARSFLCKALDLCGRYKYGKEETLDMTVA